ncbi:MAG: hypothetical protein NTX25_13685 [Proteobacteria bacterium]|nr:hypothetical protein [Pseudomonadota bacterium]
MNLRLRWIMICLISCWPLSSQVLAADSFEKGLEAYRDGEYAKANKILAKVGKKAKSKSDKASALALMGACSIKLGNKSRAKSQFAKAIKLDPNVSLSKDINKDKSVGKLFAKTKRDGGDDLGGGDDGFSSIDDSEGSAGKTDDLRAEKSASGSRKSMGISALFPLGLGFFMSGHPIKGILYGGAQVGGAVSYFLAASEISKANKEAETAGTEIIADQAAGKTVDPEALTFLDDNEKFVKSKQSLQTISIAIMALGYGVGVIDGLFLSGPAKTRKSASQSSGAHESMSANHKWMDQESAQPRLGWELKLSPLPSKFGGSALLSLDRNF